MIQTVALVGVAAVGGTMIGHFAESSDIVQKREWKPQTKKAVGIGVSAAAATAIFAVLNSAL